MRIEPPVVSPPVPDAPPYAAAPDVVAGRDAGRCCQDHARGQGMNMILTKAFYRIFAVIGFGVGCLGVVFCFGSIEGVMIGAPLMLLGFACGYIMVTENPAFTGEDYFEESISSKFNKGDTWDSAFLATGEMRVSDQITRGEGRFADIK